MKIEKVTRNVWKLSQEEKPLTRITLSSNIYVIKQKEITLIDLGNKLSSKELLKALSEIGVKPEHVKKIIYTHLHFDHTGDPSFFPNARLYASKEEIADLQRPSLVTFFPPSFKNLKIFLLKKLEGFVIISTPGHTRGSICLYMKKEKVLFSGDTLFRDKITGRTDLMTSTPNKIADSLKRINKISYKILCPGHSRNDGKRLLF